jgi:4-amino-4-deoxy-L-arabinose transferase-like glycosyltransferase
MRFHHAFLILLALWAGLFLPGLGDTELKGEEGRRILPAREMLRRGDYVLPYSEGRPYHRKPPGINWAIAASFKVTGQQNEWSARLPSVLAALGLALAGLWAGKSMRGTAFGLCLGTALLVNGGMLEKARLAEIESLYISLAGIGMLCWAACWLREKRSATTWFSTVIPFALANLVKGPVYLLFFYPIVMLAIPRGKRLKELVNPAHLAALALSLLPMIVWGYLVKQAVADLPAFTMIDDDGQEVSSQSPANVWWQQISGRLQFDQINAADWAMLPFRVLLLLAPWPVLAWFARVRATDTLDSRWVALRRALGWGSVLSIGLFCILPATRARYLLPALAPVTLWAVMCLAPWLQEAQRSLSRHWERLMLGLLCVAGIGGIILPWTLAHPSPGAACLWNGLGFALLLILAYQVRRSNQPVRFFLLTGIPFTLLALLIATSILPVAKSHENVRPTAEKINAVTRADGIIAVLNPGPQPFLFYLGARCVEVGRLSEFPEPTDYVLLPPRLYEDGDMKDRLAKRGFTETLLTLRDDRPAKPREYLLLGKSPNVSELSR